MTGPIVYVTDIASIEFIDFFHGRVNKGPRCFLVEIGFEILEESVSVRKIGTDVGPRYVAGVVKELIPVL